MKFKAYIRDFDKIVPVESIDFHSKTIDVDIDNSIYEFDFDKVDIMQFTGVRDINNKDIYVMDIVKVECVAMTNSITYIGRVVDMRSIISLDNKRMTGLDDMLSFKVIAIEVIGNTCTYNK